MHAMIFTLCLVQLSHCVMSMLNTRLSRCAQLMLLAWYSLSMSLSASSSLGLLLPRFDAVTSARTQALGANTPKKRTRFSLGGGTIAASFPIKSSGSKNTCVVPSLYGVFSSYLTLPVDVRLKRSSLTAGLQYFTINDFTNYYSSQGLIYHNEYEYINGQYQQQSRVYDYMRFNLTSITYNSAPAPAMLLLFSLDLLMIFARKRLRKYAKPHLTVSKKAPRLKLMPIS